MALVKVDVFSGIVPRTSPRLLGVGQAQVAENCRLWARKLEPWRQPGNPVTLTKVGPFKSVYLYAGLYWFQWTTDVDVVESPIANNTNHRVYFTGDGVPKMTDDTVALSGGTDYPMNSVILGIPAPSIAPTSAVIQRTNYADTSNDLTAGAETIDLSVPGPDSYTLSVSGTAQVTVAASGTTVGTGFGQAKAGTPVTFNLTTADTITLTLNSGTLDTTTTSGQFIHQVEPGSSATLFIESPGTGPTQSTIPSDPNTVESRAYVYTWVRRWNGIDEESKPSPPSAIITVTPGSDTVTVTTPTAGPSGNYLAGSAAWYQRIYRTNTGVSSTDYQFVAEIAVSTQDYLDSKLSSDLVEVLGTVDYDEPPSNMVGLVDMPNGIVVGFRENEICPSAAYQPHTYPLPYRQSTKSTIVGIKVFGHSALVTTTEYPYLLTGVDPSALTLEKIEILQACVSKRSMVDMGDYVLYASPDGLVAVGPGIAKVLTEPFFTRDEWQAMKPSSMIGYHLDGRYYGFYDTGAVQAGFIFDPGEGVSSFTDLTVHYDTGYNDIDNDKLYVVSGQTLSEWESDAVNNMTVRWKSGIIIAPYPTCPGAGQVIGQHDVSNPTTFKLYANGVLKHTENVTSDDPFRLPSGYFETDFEVEVSGTRQIDEVLVANTMPELRLG